jgi:hypothetical protein
MADREFPSDLARRVIVEALKGDLLKALPGAFTADIFGESPRKRIAEVIVKYVADRGVRPKEDEVQTILVRDLAARSDPESDAVIAEWEAVKATDPAEDPGFTYDEVRAWVEFRRIRDGLVAAREALDADDGAEKAREALARIEPVRRTVDLGPVELRFAAGVDARLAQWREGSIIGDRIPTGMRALDGKLMGGPTKRESWYYLAPPKGAKTTFLLNTARGASIAGYGVYVNTFEMQAMRMMMRLDQMVSKSSKEQLSGDTDRVGSVFRLEKAIEGLRSSGSGEIIVTSRPTQQKGSVKQVRQDILRLRREGAKIDVVILDYLNIMGASKDERELRRELFGIAYEISDMAKELDVLVWSAALVTRQAATKVPVVKTDIAESFGVLAAVDGAVAICSPTILVQNGYRRLYITAAREVQDEVMAGDYKLDFTRMTIEPADSNEVERLLASTRRGKKDDE